MRKTAYLFIELIFVLSVAGTAIEQTMPVASAESGTEPPNGYQGQGDGMGPDMMYPYDIGPGMMHPNGMGPDMMHPYGMGPGMMYPYRPGMPYYPTRPSAPGYPPATPQASGPFNRVDADQMLGYIRARGLPCLQCHSIADPGFGPPFTAIAQVHMGQKDEKGIIESRILHGFGRMPPGLANNEQAKTLANLIVGLFVPASRNK